jgi:3-oxoacyl-(acyl-carrier-protein) synthase
MRIGEGAAYLCIEQLGFARARGADVRAEIIGYGNAFEPPDSEAVLVQVSARAVERAIRMALADAELAPNEIDLVASAQSGIARFDATELAGIDAALGREVPVATPKSIYGETFGAGAALAMACAVAWFRGVSVAPLLRRSHQRQTRHILVTAVGYYGNASALVMRRHD